MPGSVSISQFNNDSKWGWFFADLQGSMYASVLTSLIVLFTFGPLGWLQKMNWWAIFAVIYIPAFILVFCLRRNMCVIGPRRSFRYFCRWL